MAGTPITTGSFAKALYPGVNKWYGQEYTEYPVEWNNLFNTYKTNRAWVEDVSIASMGLAQIKGEAAGVQFDNEMQGFVTRYTNVTYGLGFVITKEMYEDDMYDVTGERRARGLAFSMRQTKEVIGANVYNRAFNASYVFGDGTALLNSAHVNVSGGTWSNILSVASDLSEASLEQACIDVQKFTTDRGLRISVVPQSLIVAVDGEYDAMKIMQTPQEVGTANNTMNVIRGKFPKGLVVNHYLTDPDAWFIRTNVPDGMKYFERRPDTFSTDDDFDTDNAKFKATGRYAFGATDVRGLYGSPGA